MWYCVCVSLIFVSLLTLYINNLTIQNLITNTSIELNIFDRKQNDSFNLSKKIVGKKKFKHHVPKFMLDLYEEIIRSGFGRNATTRPDVVRSLIPKSAGYLQPNILVETSENDHLLIFDLPSWNEDEKFLSAELRILTLVEVNSEISTGVERVLKLSIYDDKKQKLKFLQQLHVYHTDNTWLKFNMTKPVIELMSKTPQDNYLKIVISIKNFLPHYSNTTGKLKLSLMPVVENFEHDYPILLLSYQSNNKKVERTVRKKRNAEEDYEEETNQVWDDEYNKKIARKNRRARNTCKRKPLYVDFAEIEYDSWIVQPSGYEAYQCQGKCFYPVAEHLNPTKHAIVQALLHSVAPARAPRSCCVPTKLEPISVLYVDDAGVLTYRYAYSDMVVAECGCR